MRLKRKEKKCILIILILFIIFLFNMANVSAEINDTYGSSYVVDNTGLNESMEDSTVLDLLGHLVYAVGRLLEWILGSIFQAITGSSSFPWADKIVFNAVPILDVNFINPNSNSFLGITGVQKAIADTYATIFSIALSFFGVFAMISAIKLAISTIAEQKAKYKQALVDWSLGFIMIFCMHYFMSFIFYLNEELVKTASEVASTAVATAGQKFQLQAAGVSKELINQAKASLDPAKGDYLEQNTAIIQQWTSVGNEGDEDKGIHNIMKNEDPAYDRKISENDQYENLYQVTRWINDECPSSAVLEEIKGKIFYAETPTLGTANNSMLTESEYGKLKLVSLKSNLKGADVLRVNDKNYSGSDVNQMFDGLKESGNIDAFYALKSDGSKGEWINGSSTEGSAALVSYGLSKGNPIKLYMSGDNWNFVKVLDDLIKLKVAAENGAGGAPAFVGPLLPGSPVPSGGTTNTGAVISELATYFKETSYDMELRGTDVTSTKKDKDNVNTTNAILYAILVAQSLILFISYIKRLFYVIMLGMISPAVVAYDFFKRFGR